MIVTETARAVVEIADSGASTSMSGVKGRLVKLDRVQRQSGVRGFDGSVQQSSVSGTNVDGVREIYVPGMPDDLALLCAYEYAKRGAIILTEKGGVILRFSEEQKTLMEAFISEMTEQESSIRLDVSQRVYVVRRDEVASAVGDTTIAGCVSGVDEDVEDNDEWAAHVTTYFNGGVPVSGMDERITAMIFSGFSLADLRKNVTLRLWDGMDPSITLEGCAKYEKLHGRVNSLVQTSYFETAGLRRAYESQKYVYTYVGECVEVDVMFSDYNTVRGLTNPGQEFNAKGEARKQVSKLMSYGGAMAATVAVDRYSQYVSGYAEKSLNQPEVTLKKIVDEYGCIGHKVRCISSDVQVVPQSMFDIFTPKAQAYLLSQHIRYLRGEAYNHAIGGSVVENTIRQIKRLMRVAFAYMLQNPNVKLLGWEQNDLLKLWLEVFFWAIVIINLRECKSVAGVCRYEIFFNERFNMQRVRLYPFGAIVLAKRHLPNPDDQTNVAGWERGLYLGPGRVSPSVAITSGSVRVAKIVGEGQVKRVYVQVTSQIKCVSDGGDIDSNIVVERGTGHMIHLNSKDEVDKVDEVRNSLIQHSVPLTGSGGECDAQPNDRIISSDTLYSDTSNDTIPFDKPDTVSIPAEATVNEGGNTVHSSALLDHTAHDGEIEPAHQRSEIESEVEVKLSGQYDREYTNPFTAARSRAERAQRRASLALFCTDWTIFEEGDILFDLEKGVLVSVDSGAGRSDDQVDGGAYDIEVGYVAVKEDVPRSWAEALKHPVWGDAARAEWENIAQKTLVKVDSGVARDAIDGGADLVMLFPVYEKKEKEGKVVFKVRLVVNGKTHMSAGKTYSSTPSRVEFKIFVNMVASENLEWAHVDEIRAFLNSERIDTVDIFTKLRGEKEYWRIIGALYGLKTSPHDYQETAVKRLNEMGYMRGVMCPCIFEKWVDGHKIVIYMYVDDYFFASSSLSVLQKELDVFTAIVKCTPPAFDPSKGLGMTFERDRELRIIRLKMENKIVELASAFLSEKELVDKVYIPIPASKYLVSEKDYMSDLVQKGDEVIASKSEQVEYLKMVGSVLWIHGVRCDASFATMYLTWWTHSPRVHHLKMVKRVISYLYTTRDVPLVLGGRESVQIMTATDASLGTGPNSRSVIGICTRLNVNSGCVYASSKASDAVRLSTFEDELGGVVNAIKASNTTSNIMKEMNYTAAAVQIIKCDNEKTVGFVTGDTGGEGLRHAERKLWYAKTAVLKGDIVVQWESGKTIAADPMTKCKSKEEQLAHISNVQGLSLLGELPYSLRVG